MNKQKHKYKVGQSVWYGDNFAKVIRRLDGKMYQVKYSYWMRNITEVVPEESLFPFEPKPRLNKLETI